ncbi:hypothetical protein BKP54_21615 [Ensifer sp. 1H6]|nr:hypothetical protein BKP54_21615 [Ensifer sp. 1H6]
MLVVGTTAVIRHPSHKEQGNTAATSTGMNCGTDGPGKAGSPRRIQAGLPTEATMAHFLVSKYADQTPLNRQARIMSHQGIDLDRPTLADRFSRAAYQLHPVFNALIADPKR